MLHLRNVHAHTIARYQGQFLKSFHFLHFLASAPPSFLLCPLVSPAPSRLHRRTCWIKDSWGERKSVFGKTTTNALRIFILFVNLFLVALYQRWHFIIFPACIFPWFYVTLFQFVFDSKAIAASLPWWVSYVFLLVSVSYLNSKQLHLGLVGSTSSDECICIDIAPHLYSKSNLYLQLYLGGCLVFVGEFVPVFLPHLYLSLYSKSHLYCICILVGVWQGVSFGECICICVLQHLYLSLILKHICIDIQSNCTLLSYVFVFVFH